MATNTVFGMFARSPMRALVDHMITADECAQLLMTFVEQTQKAQWEEAEKTQGHISDLEHKADEQKKDLRLHLPKSLFLPVSRTDILELLTMQDTVANKTKDIAGIMLGRKMMIPESIYPSFVSYLNCGLKASNQAKVVISELDELLEAGFKGAEVKLVKEMILTLDELEHESDRQQVDIRKQLYTLEKDLPPIDVMFLYKVIEEVGELADHAQKVGGRLQLLLAR